MLSECVAQVQKYARVLVRPQLTGDSSPVVVEEYMFETERRDGRVNMSRLVIMQRLNDESFLGTLYVDRDFKDSDPKGNACRCVCAACLLLVRMTTFLKKPGNIRELKAVIIGHMLLQILGYIAVY